MERYGERTGAASSDMNVVVTLGPRVDWDVPRSWLGKSEMAARVFAFDWAQTSLGPIDGWSRSLKGALASMLRSRHQMSVCWGPEMVAIYNDAERDVLRAQHPWALGRSAREVLGEAWELVGPQFAAVVRRGEACWAEEQPLVRNRRGLDELSYITYSLSPLFDDDGTVGGVLFVSEDTTAAVLEQRRFAVLRELRARSVEALTVGEACELAAGALTAGPDMPAAAVYVVDRERRIAECVGAARGGEPVAGAARAVTIDGSGSSAAGTVFEALAHRQSEGMLVDSSTFVALPPIADATGRLYVAPFARGARDPVDGFLVAGVNDAMMFDDEYREFIETAALGVGRSFGSAREREREQRQAEAIVALERAKAAVVHNTSHELRTPVSLILGELEMLLDRGGLDGSARAQLGSVQRSAMRMLKLINGLLDISRLEAGERLGELELTDVGQLTRDLAAMFTSTAERAGLVLSINCPSTAERAWVDREGWEQIVCNLLSNALKFTVAGTIVVHTRVGDGWLVLTVEDTGIGILDEETDRIFSRFHRGSDPRARSHEGSGIGLALVRELVTAAGGTIEATSSPAGGTQMIVAMPLAGCGDGGGAPSACGSGAPGRYASLSVAEAEGWLEFGSEHDPDFAREPAPADDAADRERILVVEDSADMRAYLRRLLGGEFLVQVARNGAEACALAIADPPSLVVSDVMMPGWSGFDLIREFRSKRLTREVPVILISARADPRSTEQALRAGADDLISKPFGARELLTRVRATLSNTRLRSDAAAARARVGEHARSERVLRSLVDDLKAAQRRVADAADAERTRIEQNLHDGAQQRLLAIRLELATLAKHLQQGQPGVLQELEQLRVELDDALEELREIAHGLYPPLLASDGLEVAIRAAVRRAPVEVTIAHCDVSRAPQSIESTVYFCCLEALQNVAKHGGPGVRAMVQLRTSAGALAFEVSDDGAGFDPAAVRPGHGLINLNDRVEALGGAIEVVSRAGCGATVRGEIPLL